jgi:hypothetical protein
VEGSVEIFFWRLVGSGLWRTYFMQKGSEEGLGIESEGGRQYSRPRLA